MPAKWGELARGPKVGIDLSVEAHPPRGQSHCRAPNLLARGRQPALGQAAFPPRPPSTPWSPREIEVGDGAGARGSRSGGHPAPRVSAGSVGWAGIMAGILVRLLLPVAAGLRNPRTGTGRVSRGQVEGRSHGRAP